MDEYMKTYLAVFIVIVGISTYFIVKYIRESYNKIPSQSAIEQLKTTQRAALEKTYLGVQRKDRYSGSMSKIPALEQLLINSAVFSAGKTGFI